MTVHNVPSDRTATAMRVPIQDARATRSVAVRSRTPAVAAVIEEPLSRRNRSGLGVPGPTRGGIVQDAAGRVVDTTVTHDVVLGSQDVPDDETHHNDDRCIPNRHSGEEPLDRDA